MIALMCAPESAGTIMGFAGSDRKGRSAVWIVSSLPYLSPRQEGEVDAWTEEAAEAGRVGTLRLPRVSLEIPPSEVRSALSLAPGEAAVIRRRTMLLDGQPVELTDSWYPAEIAEGTAL